MAILQSTFKTPSILFDIRSTAAPPSLLMFSIFGWNTSQEKEESGTASIPVAGESAIATRVNITFVGLNSLPSSRHHCRNFACKLLWNGHWWSYILLRGDSWAGHSISAESESDARTGIRTVITKVEKQGPYTRPYSVYLLHTKTAFSVKAAARRFKEFRELVRHSITTFIASCTLPKSVHLIFSHRIPKFAASSLRCPSFLRLACLTRWSLKLSLSAGGYFKSISMRWLIPRTFAKTGVRIRCRNLTLLIYTQRRACISRRFSQ